MQSTKKLRYILSALFAVVVGLSAATITFAQGGSFTIEGVVTTPSGQPSSRMTVSLMYRGAMVSEAVTDAEGHYFFSNLNQGVYQIVAHGDGKDFEDTTVSVEVSSLHEGISSVFRQDIQLRPKQRVGYAPGTVAAEENDKSIPEEARKDYRNGIKSAKDNNPEKAIKYFESAIQIYPKFSSAELGVADEYAKVGKLDDAIAAYKKAIEIRPDMAAAHRGLGITLVKQKNFKDAVPSLKRSIELDRTSANAYMFLGVAEIQTSDYQNAETDLLKAYEMSKAPTVHLYLANLYTHQNDAKKALDQLDSFLRERPDDPNAPKIRAAADKLRNEIKSKK